MSASNTRAPAKDGQRIAKLLARAGIASRREIERMIAEGRVAIDGKPIETPATILASLRGVTVDGNPVAAPAPARLFAYHKPIGLLVTERDPKGRPTIYDRLPHDLPRVVPVGRLDLNTEGLLLLTTDGELKRQLELPATGVERTYRARTYGPVTQAQLEDLIDGVEIDGVRYGSIDANLERRTGTNAWIELTLKEGKNREVRRVLEHLGLKVSRLIRTRYGPFVLADMAPGEVGEIRQHDVIAFRRNPTKSEIHVRAAEKKEAPSPRAPAAEPEKPRGKRPARPKAPLRKPREDKGPANAKRADRAKAFQEARTSNPPPEGEGDRAKRGGGVASREHSPARSKTGPKGRATPPPSFGRSPSPSAGGSRGPGNRRPRTRK